MIEPLSVSNGITSSQTLTIHHLHETMLSKLECSPDKCMQYLLDSTEYLKEDDGEKTARHWIERFKPDWIPRQDPVASPQPTSLVPADHCPICLTPCAFCVKSNVVVCTDCGLVTSDHLLLNDTEHMSYDTMTRLHRKTIHFYDRYTHFKDFVQRLVGTATCTLSLKDAESLRAVLVGYPVIDPRTVEMALRKLKLTKKYLVHIVSIARELGGHEPVRIDGMDWYRLKKLFIRVSKYWRYNAKHVAPQRKSFPSYPFVFYQLAKNLDKPEWVKDVKLPKHYRTLLTLRKLWFVMAKDLQLKCFECL